VDGFRLRIVTPGAWPLAGKTPKCFHRICNKSAFSPQQSTQLFFCPVRFLFVFFHLQLSRKVFHQCKTGMSFACKPPARSKHERDQVLTGWRAGRTETIGALHPAVAAVNAAQRPRGKTGRTSPVFLFSEAVDPGYQLPRKGSGAQFCQQVLGMHGLGQNLEFVSKGARVLQKVSRGGLP
jgi:hypothetical protein